MSASDVRNAIAHLIHAKDPDRSMRPRVLGGEIAHLLTVRYPRLNGIAVIDHVAEVNASKTMTPEALATNVADHFQLDEEEQR